MNRSITFCVLDVICIIKVSNIAVEMDTLVSAFTQMDIYEQKKTNNQPVIDTTIQMRQIMFQICIENNQLKQQVKQLKMLLQSQQPIIPHWVR